MTDAIVVEGVSKTFRIPLDRATTLKYRVTHLLSSGRMRDFPALMDIGFSVPKGQFLGIVGHNGSGKSTLLKLLSRIYVPDCGEIRIDGRVSPFLELGVGFNPELTARENVYLNGAVLGISRREIDEKVDAILQFAEVADFSEMKLKNFSSGMQVRLAFSVAIEADAEVLLMDEVLAVGDARFAEKCFDVFARYKRDGRTVVLVTHDIGSVNAYCDRALLLDHGRLVADGRPDEVTALYRRMALAPSEGTDDALEALLDGDPGRAPDQGLAENAADAPRPAWLPAEAERWGSRELEISRLRMLDDRGKRVASSITGRPLTVELTYRVRRAVDGLVCLLGIYRNDGVLIAGPNSLLETGGVLECPPEGATATLRYRMAHVPLLSAGYYVSAALYDRHAGHAYDHIERGLVFHVVDERVRVGLVDLGGSFEEAGAPSDGVADEPASARGEDGGEAVGQLLEAG